MTPRTEIIAIEVNKTVSSLRTALDDSHSRFPVYKKTLDDVVGFVHVKDVYKLLLTVGGGKKLGETNLIRKVISVPESKKANDVLLDMRKKHVHLAVVYDEFGVMVGIVTLEDIIESLVGDIQDEFDKPLKGIKRNSDGSFLVDGTITVEKMQRRFRLPLKGQAYNTIGGVVFGLLGREPHIGDEVQIGHLYFEVISISGKRVSQILMKRQSKKQELAP